MPSGMFLAASRELARLVSEDDLAHGSLYPALSDIRNISEKVAVAVAQYAYDHKLAQGEKPADLAKVIKDSMYMPHY